MLRFLFSPKGRIGRGGFWLGAVCHIVFALAVVGVCLLLAPIFTGSGGAGQYSFDGLASVLLFTIAAAAVGFGVWSGLCMGIKRFHDRDKDGAWILIQFVPVIGSLWYLVEAGFLKGTEGPNRFGPDPRGRSTATLAAAGGGDAL